MGTKEFPILLVLLASDLNRHLWASVQTRHTGHAQGPLKEISLCVESVGKGKSPNLITDYFGAKIHNFL